MGGVSSYTKKATCAVFLTFQNKTAIFSKLQYKVYPFANNWNSVINLEIGKSSISFHFFSANSDSSKFFRTKGLQKFYDVNKNSG